MHTPVLLQQAIDKLDVKKDGQYVDATFGEGGYAGEIVRRGGKVLGIDLDPVQAAKASSKGEFKVVQGNFADIERIVRDSGVVPVDGVIFDLGLSMEQLDHGGRGLSYNKINEPLDMRIDPNTKDTARDLIKKSSEDELYEILAHNSEELKSREIAREIKLRKRMDVVFDLISAIDKAAGFKSRTIYARIFQALRIEVNHELENLKKGLVGAVNILKENGKIVVVSFHSLEDRIVKSFAKAKGYRLERVKPEGADLKSFERSAKIRCITI